MTPELETLCRRYWDRCLRAFPLRATLLGDHRFDEELPDLSREAEEAFREDLQGIAEAARAVDPQGLQGQDRITRSMLVGEARRLIRFLEAGMAELDISPQFGPHAELLHFPLQVTLSEPEQAGALLVRYRKVGECLGQALERLRQGVSRGRTPAAHLVEQVSAQIQELLARPLEEDPFLTPTPPPGWEQAQAAAWREDLAAAVREVVRPALGHYGEGLAREILPHARAGERAGLMWLPGGEQTYAALVEVYVSPGRGAEEIQAIGQEATAGLVEEYRRLGERALGEDRPEAIFARLRDDPGLRYESGEEILKHAQEALARARAAVPAWFGRLPRADCRVRPMAPFEEKVGTIAYYQDPAADGSRPGTYYVNTYAPQTRRRFEAEALTYHESVPGHHLQVALAQELSELPEFRRHSLVTVYVEGWALYTERLADEMGLYSGDLDRLGMLSFDSWRAGRLVVDTGLHALGWSRQQAIDYLAERTPLAVNNIENEVDRYIAVPGQALAYKMGQREIAALRREAQRRLGRAWDIRGFHDVVLTSGAVDLPTLRELVHAWLADQSGIVTL